MPRIAWLGARHRLHRLGTRPRQRVRAGVSLKVSRLSATPWSRAAPLAPCGGEPQRASFDVSVTGNGQSPLLGAV